MESFFVKQKTVRLPIFGGRHWIDVFHELNHGQLDELFSSAQTTVQTGNTAEVQIRSKGFRGRRLLAHLIGWSLHDEGVPMPIGPREPENERTDTINALSEDVFNEIERALNAYQTERDRQKKDQADLSEKPNAGTTSPLPSAAAGVLTGSAI